MALLKSGMSEHMHWGIGTRHFVWGCCTTMLGMMLRQTAGSKEHSFAMAPPLQPELR